MKDSKSAGRKSARLSDTNSRVSSATLQLPPSPPRTEYKHGLAKLVAANKKQQKQEARIAEIEAEVAAAEEKRAKLAAEMFSVADDGLIDEYAKDSEAGDRVKQAIKRTEAAKDEERFTYFLPEGVRVANEDFPWICFEGTPLETTFEEERKRSLAFLSGFAADLAAEGKLPPEVTRWMVNQLVHEEREDLRNAYLSVLGAMKERNASFSIDVSLRDFYYTCTSSAAALAEIGRQVGQPRRTTLDGVTSVSLVPAEYRHVVQAIGYCTPTQDTDRLACTIFDLALASLDDRLAHDTSFHLAVQDTLETLLHESPQSQLHDVCKRLIDQHSGALKAETLSRTQLCKLVCGLPATSPELHWLRRDWARYIVAAKDPLYANTNDSIGWHSRILAELQNSPDWNIADGSTDYDHLFALVNLLDVAVDAGLSPIPPPDDKAAVKAFNKQVDELVRQLNYISSRIKGMGASQLRRTEAKSALETLVLRLQYSVRTKPLKKKSVFGRALGAEQGTKGFLDKFVSRDVTFNKEPKEEANREGARKAVQTIGDETMGGAEDVTVF